MTECIHGLDAELGRLLAQSAPLVSPTVRIVQPRRTAAPKTKNASSPRRRHVVVDIDELAAVLAGELETSEWSAEPPLTGFDRVVLIAPVDDVSQVSLIAVANKPARIGCGMSSAICDRHASASTRHGSTSRSERRRPLTC